MKRSRPVVSVLCALLFLGTGARAVSATSPAGNTRTEFSNLALETRDKEIYSILQDSDGAIWFGSKYGLVFYDGFHFRTYLHEGGSSRNTINAMVQWDCPL